MMETGVFGGALEVRSGERGGVTLAGRFPYDSVATLGDGGRNGRPKKERFAPRAFAQRIEDPDAEIHLLSGHRYDKPLASRSAGTLDVTHNDAAVSFLARITSDLVDVAHVRDTLALVRARLAKGISPGFRLPPARRVPKPERFDDEGFNLAAGAFNAQIRTVTAALLFELSIVTQPAYPETEVEAEERAEAGTVRRIQPAARWRL